jgi:hypothetical protein
MFVNIDDMKNEQKSQYDANEQSGDWSNNQLYNERHRVCVQWRLFCFLHLQTIALPPTRVTTLSPPQPQKHGLPTSKPWPLFGCSLSTPTCWLHYWLLCNGSQLHAFECEQIYQQMHLISRAETSYNRSRSLVHEACDEHNYLVFDHTCNTHCLQSLPQITWLCWYHKHQVGNIDDFVLCRGKWKVTIRSHKSIYHQPAGKPHSSHPVICDTFSHLLNNHITCK